jgi:hypothetical protein
VFTFGSRFPAIANFVRSSLNPINLMIKTCSSETSVLTRRERRYIHLVASSPKEQNDLRGFQSARALYRLATADGRQILMPTFVDRGVSRS